MCLLPYEKTFFPYISLLILGKEINREYECGENNFTEFGKS